MITEMAPDVAARTRRRWHPPVALVDCLAILALIAVSLLGFRSSFGGWEYLLRGMAGAVLGTALAWAAWRTRRPILTLAAVALLLGVALAALLALPETAMLGALPTAATMRGLAQGVTRGWLDLVGLAPPVGDVGNLMAIPYACGLTSAVVAATLALRGRHARWAVVPPAAVLAAGILTGTEEPVSLLAQGVGFAAISIGWWSWREQADTQVTGLAASGARRGMRSAMAVGLLAVAGVAGMVVGPALPGSSAHHRFLLRDYIEPQLDLSRYPSPLTAVRRYLMTQTDRDRLLFTVTGLPAGVPIRLAVMDNWDGTSMGVAGVAASDSSGEFRRVGSEVPTTLTGHPAQVQVTVADYNDYWIPSVGGTRQVAFAGPRSKALQSSYYYNPASDSALTTSGLRSGDVITLAAVVPDPVANPESLGLSPASLPTLAKAPDSLVDMAAELVGDGGSPYERAVRMVKALHEQGFYTPHGTDSDRPPGHGYVRLSDFASGDQWVGDEEQYGAVATLLARQVAVPARLVLGFRGTDTRGPEGEVEVRGSDVDVWLEVALAGPGWVPLFDLTPPRDQLPAKADKPKPKPRPEVQVPPVPQPESQQEATSQDVAEPDKPEAGPPKSPLPTWVLVGGVAAAVPLALLALYVAVVLALKRRRRAARRRQPDTGVAVAGGWQELLDAAVDNGLAPPAGAATRREASVALASQLPGEEPEVWATLDLLARRADAAVFAPIPPTPELVRDYWDDVATASGMVTARRGRLGRARARLSLGSLRAARARRRAARSHGSGWLARIARRGSRRPPR